jgi:hypothetical protein
MSGKKKVEAVGISLIVFCFVHTIVLIILADNAGITPSVWRSMTLSSLVRLVIVWILCAALLAGAGWARVLLGLFAALGVVVSALGWFALPGAGGSMISTLGLWIAAMGFFYAGVVYMLFMDGNVINHFDPRGGF